MEKKKLLALIICIVLLFAAAVFGYNRLSAEYDPYEENETPSSTEDTSAAEEKPQKEVIIAPDFTVYDAEGNAVSLSDFKGKPVVIGFWATWCGYCVSGLPTYEKAIAEYGDEVVFMLINVTDGVQETKENVTEFIEKNGYDLPIYYDTELSAAFAYGASSLPATGFITKDGVFHYGILGALSEERLFGYIENLLDA